VTKFDTIGRVLGLDAMMDDSTTAAMRSTAEVRGYRWGQRAFETLKRPLTWQWPEFGTYPRSTQQAHDAVADLGGGADLARIYYEAAKKRFTELQAGYDRFAVFPKGTGR
jgi:hypothetical protein